MQIVFGNYYPLYFSIMFATMSAYFACFYDSPDKFALTLLAAAASLGWMCLHGAETILAILVNKLEDVTESIQKVLHQPEE